MGDGGVLGKCGVVCSVQGVFGCQRIDLKRLLISLFDYSYSSFLLGVGDGQIHGLL